MREIKLWIEGNHNEGLEVDSESTDPVVRSNIARLLVESINDKPLGSGFLYQENNLWASVKSDPEYPLGDEVEDSYAQHLALNFRRDIDSILFVGPGDGEEIKTTRLISSNESPLVSIVDLSMTQETLRRVAYNHSGQITYYTLDFTSKGFISLWDQDSSVHNHNHIVIKGGTVGNVGYESFVYFLKNARFNDIYFDLFEVTSNPNPERVYNIDSIVKLGLYKYMQLFSDMGVPSNFTHINDENMSISSNFVDAHKSYYHVRKEHHEFGYSIVAEYNVPQDIYSMLTEVSEINCPKVIELFRSERFNGEDFADRLKQDIPDLNIVNRNRVGSVGSFFVSK